jgi:hypothetical protein
MEVISPFILNLGIRWSKQSPVSPGALFLEKETRKLYEPQSQSAHFGEEMNLVPLPGNETGFLQPPTHSLVMIDIFELSVPKSIIFVCVQCVIYGQTQLIPKAASYKNNLTLLCYHDCSKHHEVMILKRQHTNTECC